MSITNLDALTRTIDHREIFHDEMLALMRRIKGALDPRGIMNPGRVLAEQKPKQENP
mgnify:CR=1 FL=1